MRAKKKGFTLVELLVVMAIIAIIAAVAVPVVIGQIDKAHKKSDKMFFESLSDTVYTTISNRSSSNYGKIKLGDVLTLVYQNQSGEFNAADPMASNIGNAPYPILPATLPVGSAFPTSGKFVVVRLVKIKDDVAGNAVDRAGFEVVMYDADKGNTIIHANRVSFGETVPFIKYGIDEHNPIIVDQVLANTDELKKAIGKDISLATRVQK